MSAQQEIRDNFASLLERAYTIQRRLEVLEEKLFGKGENYSDNKQLEENLDGLIPETFQSQRVLNTVLEGNLILVSRVLDNLDGPTKVAGAATRPKASPFPPPPPPPGKATVMKPVDEKDFADTLQRAMREPNA